jgi:class 3 adenylate cyclase
MAEGSTTTPEAPGLSLRHRLAGFKGRVHALAWSPDGRVLAVACGDQILAAGEGAFSPPYRSLREGTGEVRDLEWSPDGRLLASVSAGRTADVRREFDAGLVSATGEMRTQGFRQWAGGGRATLALVFTDVIGSTALASELGNEAWNELRRGHFRRGRELLARHGGYEIKTIGDSMMVAFRTTAAALNFALGFAADTGHGRVRIRAGVHVGPVQIEEGDAFGSMVNFTARLQHQAKGVEIWVSARAKEDIDEERARAHEGLAWVEHPACELKGFAGTHRLWSTAAPPGERGASAP